MKKGEKVYLLYNGYINEEGTPMLKELVGVFGNESRAEIQCWQFDFVEIEKINGQNYYFFDSKLKKRNDDLLKIESLRRFKKIVEHEVF